ncbi:MAG TPA: gephyrin-like molybdotransferase Glp [Acidimicrobiales bacterium]|nr:gephyrin-like molybdotransferase Glp [Acidimicrobiales bacterium]
MIPLEDARARVLADCPPLRAAEVPLAEALGLVLAEDVDSGEAVPPFASSAMDGYAVLAADVAGASHEAPARLRIVGTLAAGAAPTTPVRPGEAVRIMTGAPFPPGADSVAIVETTRAAGDTVEILEPARRGAHVRPAGEDLAAGQRVFDAGTPLGPGHLGVLASIGRERVAAVPAPVVGVLSTGDELTEGGTPLEPGKIRDSNRRTLLALLRRDGFVPVDLGIARDVEADIRARLEDATGRCDAVLTSGGVSMGDYDYVKKVLDELGDMSWMQVAIRPAKPFAFGVVGETPVFGLPGNPVSSMVSYELLARPGLRRRAGYPDALLRRPSVRAVAGGELRRPDDDRVTFVRVVAEPGPDGRLRVRSAGGQGSNLLWPMALANALAVLPPGPGASAGDEVDVLVTS